LTNIIMKLTSFVLGAAAVAMGARSEESYQTEFTQWIKKHSKSYELDEIFHFFNNFKSNLDKIEAHNAGDHTWSMGLNEFADLSADEFSELYHGFKEGQKRAGEVYEAPADYKPSAAGVDWRTKGVVTPVKNQGQCGSCWAFSTTGSTEGIVAITNGKLVSLSEQQLVDCAGSTGNMGCQGGLMDNAFKWIKQNGGLCSESDYPYTAAKSMFCKKTCTVVPGTHVTSFTDVGTNEAALASAVDNQPVSVAIEADQSSFQFYNGGIMKGLCGTRLDHGVLAVGYGTEAGTDYWIVKNSWGQSWGEQGYIRMIRGQNECGISNAASFPKL